MDNKLWVDYTNHHGQRTWREIEEMTTPYLTVYPPNEASYSGPRATTYCVTTFMVDRRSLRTLALKSIHGFHVGPTPPRSWVTSIDDAGKEPLPTTQQLNNRTKDQEERLRRIENHIGMRGGLDAGEKSDTIHEDTIGEIKSKLTEILKGQRILLKDRDGLEPATGQPGIVEAFKALQHANEARQLEWDPDTKLEGSLGTLYRANELAGEVGEVCNKVKKIVREYLGIAGSKTTLADVGMELGDVAICLVLLANDLGVDLGTYVVKAFNDKSEQLGMKTRI